MAYKTILTILSDIDDVAPVLEGALPFVQAQGAHLDILCMGIDRTQTGYYMAGAAAILHDSTLALAQTQANELEQAVRDYLRTRDVQWGVDAVVTQSSAVAHLAASRARYSDMVILPQPYGEGRTMDDPAILEAAMFQGQTPVIVLPKDGAVPASPKRVVVAWNESQEALSAVRRALPVLVAADEVNVLIIDPRHGENQPDPGSELSKLLTRHGAKVEVSIVAKTMPQISAVIQRHAQDQNADLLVMGAYGHSRFREAILGGATRNLLEQANTPVLMAH